MEETEVNKATKLLHKEPAAAAPTTASTEPATKNELLLLLNRPEVYVIFAAVTAVLLGAVLGPSLNYPIVMRTVNVAFLGNSITYANDLPRFMENLSRNRIQQNSCLHGGLSFSTLLTKGNGMYSKWQTENALMDNIVVEIEEDDDEAAMQDDENAENEASYETLPVYDYGACSIPQLLFGYDSALSSQNDNGFYTSDGNNPCFEDPYYLDYLNQKHHEGTPPEWNYVIMNDQTVYPGIASKRNKSLQILQQVYVDMFKDAGVRPVFLVTHGYYKAGYNNEDDDDGVDAAADDDDDGVYSILGDISEFTSRIWYGYQSYYELLSEMLPTSQQPVLVPAGLAFLMVYEENYDLWVQLFYDDGFHPSPHGTYLIGCCLYAALFGRKPPSPTTDDSVAALFASARLLHMASMGDDKPFPTAEEAAYLKRIAERVVLKGHRPATLLSLETVAQMEADEANDDGY